VQATHVFSLSCKCGIALSICLASVGVNLMPRLIVFLSKWFYNIFTDTALKQPVVVHS
jgi:hypothetical protein